MEYVNTTASEFEALAARIGKGPCLYSIISGWDWHLRLCFVRIYPNGSNRSGRIITSGELEIVTDAAEWFLFDTKRFANRKWLVASNTEYGWGNWEDDHFSGRAWRLDISRLPQLTLLSEAFRLDIFPNESASSTHACWHIYQEDTNINKYYSGHEKTVEREDFPR